MAMCFCPCAMLSCLTLTLVKAPYVADQRHLVRLARNRHQLRKVWHVRDVDDDERLQGELIKVAAVLQWPIREWGELAYAATVSAEGSSMSDPAEKVWTEMY
jgi:hypothetical protein